MNQILEYENTLIFTNLWHRLVALMQYFLPRLNPDKPHQLALSFQTQSKIALNIKIITC